MVVGRLRLNGLARPFRVDVSDRPFSLSLSLRRVPSCVVVALCCLLPLILLYTPNPDAWMDVSMDVRRVSLNMLYKANWDPEVVEDPFRGRPVDLTAVSLSF